MASSKIRDAMTSAQGSASKTHIVAASSAPAGAGDAGYPEPSRGAGAEYFVRRAAGEQCEANR